MAGEPFGRDYLGNVRRVPHPNDVTNRSCRYCARPAACHVVWARGAFGKPGPVRVAYCGSCSIKDALASRGMAAPVAEGVDYHLDYPGEAPAGPPDSPGGLTPEERVAYIERELETIGAWGADDFADFYRRDVPALLAEIRRLRAALAGGRERCAGVADGFSNHQWADPKVVANAIRRGT